MLLKSFASLSLQNYTQNSSCQSTYIQKLFEDFFSIIHFENNFNSKSTPQYFTQNIVDICLLSTNIFTIISPKSCKNYTLNNFVVRLLPAEVLYAILPRGNTYNSNKVSSGCMKLLTVWVIFLLPER